RAVHADRERLQTPPLANGPGELAVADLGEPSETLHVGAIAEAHAFARGPDLDRFERFPLAGRARGEVVANRGLPADVLNVAAIADAGVLHPAGERQDLVAEADRVRVDVVEVAAVRSDDVSAVDAHDRASLVEGTAEDRSARIARAEGTRRAPGEEIL